MLITVDPFFVFAAGTEEGHGVVSQHRALGDPVGGHRSRHDLAGPGRTEVG